MPLFPDWRLPRPLQTALAPQLYGAQSLFSAPSYSSRRGDSDTLFARLLAAIGEEVILFPVRPSDRLIFYAPHVIPMGDTAVEIVHATYSN